MPSTTRSSAAGGDRPPRPTGTTEPDGGGGDGGQSGGTDTGSSGSGGGTGRGGTGSGGGSGGGGSGSGSGSGGGHGGGHSGNGGGTSTDLIAILDRIARAQEQQSRPVATLTVDQRRLALHYGALRNGLGNFGRHGETTVAILEPPPTLNDDGTLTFASPIQGAATVAAYDVFGAFVDRVDFAPSVHFDNDDVPGIRTIEVEDDQATPFLLSIVVHVTGTDG